MIGDLADRLCQEHVETRVLSNDRYPFADFDSTFLNRASESGLLMSTDTLGCDGSGMGTRGLATFLERVARYDAANAVMALVQVLCANLDSVSATGAPIAAAQGPAAALELRAFPVYRDPHDLALPPAAGGSAGVVATRRSDAFVLNGYVESVACLPVATSVIVPARLDEQIRLFNLDTRTRGLRISEPVVGLGLRACPVADLALQDATASGFAVADHGVEGASAAACLDEARLGVAAIAVGLMRGASSRAQEYAGERRQGRKRIIEHDMVRRMLCEMTAWQNVIALSVESLAGALDFAAPRESNARAHVLSPGLRAQVLSVQQLATSAASRATTDAVQVLGGYGYMKEYGQEKRMRDAKQLESYFGLPAARLLDLISSE